MNDDPMLSQDEMTRLQADGHDLITTAGFRSVEAYVIHLIHTAAYAHAARCVKHASGLGKTVSFNPFHFSAATCVANIVNPDDISPGDKASAERGAILKQSIYTAAYTLLESKNR